MSETANYYVESRNGGYYVSGASVSLASVVHAFRNGASAEAILQDFPMIGALSKVYGAIAFILENPVLVDEYMTEQQRLWNQLESDHPLPHDMLERFEKGRGLLDRQPA